MGLGTSGPQPNVWFRVRMRRERPQVTRTICMGTILNW